MTFNIPEFKPDDELKEELNHIEKVIDNLNEKRDQGLSKELLANLKKQLLISHVYHSNAIEGNKLSLRETELILNGMVVNERPLKDELEARSLANATKYLYSLIDGSETLSKRTLLELHGLILKDIPGNIAGKFRTEEVIIKNSEHKPPFFHDIDSHVDDMFKWMNRNSHRYHPLVMASFLHHWLTWIHPFSDGNGRVSRMFLNFFLLQKGYPEIVIRITDRDLYYNSLIEADKGEITSLVNLVADNIRDTIVQYEELINEDERQKSWVRKYKNLSLPQYEAAKSKHSFQYEVWKNQINVFKSLLFESIHEVETYLPHLDINIKEYSILSFSQYLDLLEDRKVSNTWYIRLRIFDMNKKFGVNFIFYFERLYRSKLLRLNTDDPKQQSNFTRKLPPQIKLYISTKTDGISQNLDDRIDLANIGTWKDQLSFGVINRRFKRAPHQKPKLDTNAGNPGKVIRKFIDQVLEFYFDVEK